MIHQFRDKKQIARQKSIIKTVIICCVILLLSVLGVLTWSGKIFTSLGRPIWKAENSIVSGIENSSYVVRTKASVFHENENLKKENADLKLSMIDYQVLKTENDQLKELFGRVEPKATFTIASILSRPNRSPYDTIFIDAGSDMGIAEGAPVYASATVPIGEVSRVYSDSSLVMLYSNPGQITEGILDGSNATVELTGRGGGNFEMSIPLELASEKGTAVVLPGIHAEIIALVDAIISSPTDPVKKVLLHSPVNIQGLKWVEVKKE